MLLISFNLFDFMHYPITEYIENPKSSKNDNIDKNFYARLRTTSMWSLPILKSKWFNDFSNDNVDHECNFTLRLSLVYENESTIRPSENLVILFLWL